MGPERHWQQLLDLKGIFLVIALLLASLPQSSLTIFHTTTCGQNWTRQVPEGEDVSLAISSDGTKITLNDIPRSLANYVSADLFRFNVPTMQNWSVPLGPTYPPSPFTVATSGDGSVVAAGLAGGGIQVFNGNTGNLEWNISAPLNSGSPKITWYWYQLSRDGRYFAFLEEDIRVTLRLYRELDGGLLWSYIFPQSAYLTTTGHYSHPLSISDNGSLIAALGGSNLSIFSIQSNQTLWSLQATPQTFAFLSGSGNYLAAVEGANVTALSATTGRMVSSFFTIGQYSLDDAMDSPDEAFSISADGSTAAMAAGGMLTVQDVPTGRALFAKNDFGVDTRPSSTPNPIRFTGLSLSSDGARIVVGTGLRQVAVFDRSGNQLCQAVVSFLGDGVTTVRVSTDGGTIAAYAPQTIEQFKLTSSLDLQAVAGAIVGAGLIVAGSVVISRVILKTRRERSPTSTTSEMGRIHAIVDRHFSGRSGIQRAL